MIQPQQSWQSTRVTPGAPRPGTRHDLDVWLLHRATFGFSEQDLVEVRARTYEGWLDWQLDPRSIPDPDLDVLLAPFPWLAMTPHELHHLPGLTSVEVSEMFKGVRFLRAVHSRRQLHERLIEFWSDHFTTINTRVFNVVNDRVTTRAGALGYFRDLLHAATRSSAMLVSLGNHVNFATAPNENLARELMELHTLGVDGPYTEHDVRELARALTGWTYAGNVGLPDYGDFVFDGATHDWGPKTILGLSLPGGGGVTDAERVIDLLAIHPKTIDYVTRKLARWFLGYQAPESAVRAAKAAWIQTGGHMAAVVRVLLSRSSLQAARPWEKPRLKRPFHWLASLLRATNTTVTGPLEAGDLLSQVGQLPFSWQDPDGYPDDADSWAARMQPRWAIAADHSRGAGAAFAHTAAELAPFLAGTPRRSWPERLSQVLTGGTLPASDRRALRKHALSFSTSSLDAVAEAFELAASAPGFQIH